MTFQFTKTLFLTLIAASAAVADPLKVTLGGKETTITEAQLKTLKVHEIKIVDALESKGAKKATIEYSGYDAKEFLDLALGGRSKWFKSTEIKFACADGYKAAVPVINFIKYQGYVTFARKGDATFSLVNNTQGGKKVKLAPYYLVWKAADLQNVQSSGFWPYQVVGLILDTVAK